MKKEDEGDLHAFVGAHMDRWRRTAFLMCLNWHTADDLVASTVAKLFRHWRKVRAADNPEAYAQRVLSRTWLDEQRKAFHRERPQAQLPDFGWTAPDRIADRHALAQLLESLGARQRVVVVLRFYLDFSVQEIAQILGISEGTVRSQSSRGLEALRLAAKTTNEGTRPK